MALFVGIDVSKEKFDACGIGEGGEKVFSLSSPMDRTGFEKLILHLNQRSTASLLLGLESTACYHITLFSYLTARGYRVHHQSAAYLQLREAPVEKDEDGQEGRPYDCVSSSWSDKKRSHIRSSRLTVWSCGIWHADASGSPTR